MKTKPNITLSTLADVKTSGLFLSVKKGLNEVKNKSHSTKRETHQIFTTEIYSDIISIIICTAGNHSQAIAAAESILSQSFSIDKYEVIIVNNSHIPFPKTTDKIKVITEEELGLSKARNSGAKAAKGEYLLFMDDDARANTGLLDAIYSAFILHKRFSIIGGQIYLKLPTPLPDIFLEGRESVWSGYTVPYRIFREVKEHYEFPYGACFAVKHSTLDVLGGFSENYGRCGNNYAGGEETALCFKALRYGFKIGIEPKASVTHCVDEKRFTKEHVKRTLKEGIHTTYRLCKDGYTPYVWTDAYIYERIKILNQEISRLSLQKNNLALFYKECELSAFEELKK